MMYNSSIVKVKSTKSYEKVIEMSDNCIFSQRLKESRQKKNMTQKDLAEQIGTTSATVSAYESTNGDKRKSPTLENATAIAKALNVSLDWLSGLSNINGADNKNDGGTPLTDFLQKIIDISVLRENIDIGIEEQSSGSDYDYCYANIRIYDKEVIEFIRSWGKIRELYKEKTITKEMCDDWISGAISKYSDYRICEDGTIEFWPDPGNLPF